jgi:mono/diheme cytochrome c family protein
MTTEKEKETMLNKANICRFFVFVMLILPLGAALAGDPRKGRGLYEQYCSGCHGLEGRSHVPGTPNFTLGEGMSKPDIDILEFTKKGKVVMPGFEGVLSDEEILDVIAYIRTFF